MKTVLTALISSFITTCALVLGYAGYLEYRSLTTPATTMSPADLKPPEVELPKLDPLVIELKEGHWETWAGKVPVPTPDPQSDPQPEKSVIKPNNKPTTPTAAPFPPPVLPYFADPPKPRLRRNLLDRLFF